MYLISRHHRYGDPGFPRARHSRYIVIAMRSYLLVIDSFKGCLTSLEAEAVVSETIRRADPLSEVISVPVSDGGEGMLDAFLAVMGGERVSLRVRDPLGSPVTADYGITRGQVVLIESAQAVGLHLVPPDRRNPLVASSYGVGQLVTDAYRRGYRRFIIGLGGTATCDGGVGMLQALTDALGVAREALGDTLCDCHFTFASDVTNPLYGPRGAACVFAPQKGATPVVVSVIEGRMRELAARAADHLGYDRSGERGAGAAGGLGYAFMQFLGAECRSGIDLLLEYLHFDDLVRGADCVITGEGSADDQTLMGKLPYGIMRRARSAGVPTWLVAGRVGARDKLLAAGFDRVACINPPYTPLDVAMKPEVARANLSATIRSLLEPMT